MGTFKVEPKNAKSNLYGLSGRFNDIEVVFLKQDWVDAMSRAKLCGFADWKINEVKKISASMDNCEISRDMEKQRNEDFKVEVTVTDSILKTYRSESSTEADRVLTRVK